MAQSMPGNPAENYTSSGQAGGGAGAVFADNLGGGVQRGTQVPDMQDGPRNSSGHPTNNPSGDGAAPPLDSVFGTDLGGSGVAGQERGGPISNAPNMGAPGQGGR